LFNTRPSTIREIQSWIHGRKSAARAELKNTEPGTEKYDYLLGRLAYYDEWSQKYGSLIGKKMPPKRDRSNEKNLPEHLKTKKRT